MALPVNCRVARDLLLAPASTVEVSGPVSFIHQWVDMSSYQVTLNNGSMVSTCKPALGYSFAAGTTDGPGEFDFTQGTLETNKFWTVVTSLLR